MGFTDHAFFTHDWNKDQEGRSNHDRVRAVADVCKKRGLKIWFDEDKMSGNIVDKMCEGIDNSAVVVVFVTKNYIEKVAQQDRGDDNCKLEFNYALRRRKPTMMVSVVMEPGMRSTDDWRGAVGMALGNHLYVDLSQGEMPLEAKVHELVEAIKTLIQKNEEGMTLDSLQAEIKKLEAPASAGTAHTVLFGNTKYEGKILTGSLAHGTGEFVCKEGNAKGNKYVGEFSGTIPDGQGKFTFADGEIYEGEYRNGRKNGHGTYYFNSGAKYVGGYLDGKKHGRGMYKSKDNDVYEGEYKEGKKNGFGVMKYASGNRYEGEWLDDELHGTGKYTFSDGDYYQGEYSHGKKNGHGKYVWKNGDVFVGEYKDGKKHGDGKMTKVGGKVQQGVWKDGDFQG